MSRPDQAIHAYLDGEPTPEELRAIESWVQADPAHAEAFLAVVTMHQQVGRQLRKARVKDKLTDPRHDPASASGSSVFAAEVLQALRELDQEAGEPQLQHLVQPAKTRHGRGRQSSAQQNKPIHAGDIIGVGAYLLRRALTSRPVLYTLAAVLVVGACITLVIQAGLDPTQDPAGTPAVADTQQDTPGPAASLTALRGAQWESFSSSARVGEQLAVGQTLRLTEGAAELTTASGAVARIQGPATIKIDGPNALYLHSGKLVGIVERASAKGLLIRTPHLDIVDRGTRFGVDATRPNATEVHVFQGRVDVARSHGNAGEPVAQTITAGHGIVAEADQAGLREIALNKTRFATVSPHIIPLNGTGHGLDAGAIDPNWRVVAADGQPVSRQLKVSRVISGGKASKEPTSPTTSQWLLVTQPIPGVSHAKLHTFTCQTTFELPPGVDPATATLHIFFDADDQVQTVRVNGRAHTAPPNSLTDNNTALNEMKINSGLTAGSNTIEFDIIDIVRNKGFQWGLRVQWHIETTNGGIE